MRPVVVDYLLLELKCWEFYAHKYQLLGHNTIRISLRKLSRVLGGM